MNTHKIFSFIATLGPIGYLPASGTMATLATLPLAYFLSCSHIGFLAHTALIGLVCIASWQCIDRALPFFGHDHDPSQIVLDEVCGCLCTFYVISVCMPCLWHQPHWLTFALGFALFRFFDIVKPLGIAQFEQAPGAWGILLDDIAAALYSGIAVQILLRILLMIH